MGDKQFVSRGGIKLQYAIENWKLGIENSICLDVGSSTGGFVDCLLQNGALKIYSVDTAYGELAWKLRNDPKVTVMEKTNILHLEDLPGSPVIPIRQLAKGNLQISLRLPPDRNDKVLVDLITIDAGWTRLELVLPAVKKFLKPKGKIVALLKPHYETRNKRGNLVRGVVPQEKLPEIVEETTKRIKDLGLKIEDLIESPILGGAGNKEFLLLIS